MKWGDKEILCCSCDSPRVFLASETVELNGKSVPCIWTWECPDCECRFQDAELTHHNLVQCENAGCYPN